MALTNLARVLLISSIGALVACGSSGGSTTTGTTGAGGTGSNGAASTTGAGTGGTATGSTAASTTGTTTTSGSTTSTGTTTTTGSTSSSGGTPGACTDATDKGVNMTTVGNDSQSCVESNCIPDYLSSNWSGLSTCVASCLETMDAPLTAACAACWGGVVSCGAQHCSSECGGGNSPSCTTCTDMYCTPAFDTCAGM